MKIAAMVAGALVVAVAGLAYWLGFFGQVSVVEAQMGPYAFVYVQEPSTDSGRIAEITEELGSRLEKAGIKDRQPAQVYYPTGRGIQNQIGFIVDRSVPTSVLGIDTFFRNVPKQRYVVSRFPHRNALSFIAGHYRVKPKMATYRKDKGIPDSSSMVLLEGDTIVYLQPVAQGG